MTSKKRFVFDTNVIVSALLSKKSVARQVFDRALDEGTILLSFAAIDELYDVLRRKAFDRYVTENERLQFLTVLVGEASLVDITEQITACRDPKDDKFLELAVNGRANCIISGDSDLLVLNPFREIAILSPREFLESE